MGICVVLSTGTGIYITLESAFLNSAETVFEAFVIATAKLTSVGGTSRLSNEPDILSLPPIDGIPIPS